ncbi:arginine--tRNA ligase [bacterium]|nr:MAG: arginine--tRNA ligase [bacterium]
MDKKIAHIVHELFDVDVEIKLTRPDPQFGDYSTNVAMQLARPLGRAPRQIADELAAELRQTGEFSAVDVAGPGFINFTLDNTVIVQAAVHNNAVASTDAAKTVVIETNNPNPFKAMHIGHAFNAILADTIANLLDVAQHHVYRVSYHGDVGLHVGKSMYSLLHYVDGDIEKLHAIPEAERNTFMSKMYADGSKAYKEDAAAKTEIDDLARQSFEPASAIYVQVYDLCKAWSFEQIDAIVARLGNKPTVKRFLESDADMYGVRTVQAHTPGVFQESNGALVFEGSKYGSFDNAFVASNGRGLYAARDLGLMQLKNEQYHPQKSYIVTAEEQRDYFKGVIAAAELCLPELKDVTVNISTGTVKLATGKMSSRDGDVLEIGWLFEQFKLAIEARGGTSDDAIAAGAMRYQFLKVRVGSDVVFDVNEAVSLTGNTGSYLQYAHARARRILEKVNGKGAIDSKILSGQERLLLSKIAEYGEVVERSSRELMPHHICTYLFELAQEFNRFYEAHQVVGDEFELHRAAVVRLYADTLKNGLGILGIYAPDEM